jgi:two-component system, chemotaxis family, sensor kinase CheA
MNMVGEMVIAQTLISHNPHLAGIKDPRLVGDLTQLTRITADVQRITTSMRMVPIGLQFQKTARLVRDLSRREGKQIVLLTSGEDTELDKTIAEQLSDPLLHMVRNSIDHGIETPEQRGATGKDPTARIRLAAYHQSGQIVIEIADDGRGLDRAKILTKATERGLVKAGAQLSDNEDIPVDLRGGLLHSGEDYRPLGPGRRHGCGAQACAEDARARRYPVRGRPGYDIFHQVAADARNN